MQNYFSFLDDIFHKWLENFDIKQFYDLINSLDEDLKFIFENPSRTLNFLDIQLKIVIYLIKNLIFITNQQILSTVYHTVDVTPVIPRIILHFLWLNESLTLEAIIEK